MIYALLFGSFRDYKLTLAFDLLALSVTSTQAHWGSKSLLGALSSILCGKFLLGTQAVSIFPWCRLDYNKDNVAGLGLTWKPVSK